MSRNYTELEVAQSFEKYSRMLEITAVNRPDLKPGLSMSVALVKLWTQIYAPGHPEHPFPNFGMKLPEILKAAAEDRLEMSVPRPVEASFEINNFGEDKRYIFDRILQEQGIIFSKDLIIKFREEGLKYKGHQVSNCFNILADAGVLTKVNKGVYEHTKEGE